MSGANTLDRLASSRLFAPRLFAPRLFAPRLFALALTLCASLLFSTALSGCGVRKPPQPVENIEKPRYPPR